MPPRHPCVIAGSDFHFYGRHVALTERGVPVWLIECKHADNRPAAFPIRYAGYVPNARDQRVRELRREKYRKSAMIASGASRLAELAV